MLKKLPVGIQLLPELMARGCLYADKTEGIHRLLVNAKYYFLSRLRRFGKSLLLSTIQDALREHARLYQLELQGDTTKSLFAGLLEKLAAQYGKVVVLLDGVTKKIR